MLKVCKKHQNTDNDYIVIHEYSDCPVCEELERLEKELEELYEKVNLKNSTNK